MLPTVQSSNACTRSNVENTKAVFEPAVCCSRVDIIGPGELTDSSKPLERRLGNDFSFPVVQFDKAVNRAPELVKSMRIQISQPLTILKAEQRRRRKGECQAIVLWAQGRTDSISIDSTQTQPKSTARKFRRDLFSSGV
jgi:hypothetical protein